MRGSVAITALLATTVLASPAWYMDHPSPTLDQLQEYERQHSSVAAVHKLAKPHQLVQQSHSASLQLDYVQYDHLDDDPFLYRDRVVYQVNRDISKFARDAMQLSLQVRFELSGALSPEHVKEQFYGPIHQRSLYYEHVSRVATAYEHELQEVRNMPGYETLHQDLQLIQEAVSLMRTVQGWHLHT